MAKQQQEGARIFVADDDKLFWESLHDYFHSKFVPTPHRIILEANSPQAALALIPTALQKKHINVALIDDMFEGKSHGIEIVEAITQSGLGIVMLSCATSDVDYLDQHVGKDLHKINTALNRMFPATHK